MHLFAAPTVCEVSYGQRRVGPPLGQTLPIASFCAAVTSPEQEPEITVTHRAPKLHPFASVPFETSVPFGQLSGWYWGHEVGFGSGNVHLYEVVQPYLSVIACHPVLQAVVGGGAIEQAVGAAGAHRFSMAERVRGPTTPKPPSGVPERMTPCADCHSCTDASVVGPKNPVGSP